MLRENPHRVLDFQYLYLLIALASGLTEFLAKKAER